MHYRAMHSGTPEITHHPDVDAAITAGAAVAVGVSGGKDSQAAAIATLLHLNAIGHTGPRILIHADLGIVEWNDSLPVCRNIAADLGVDLITVRRKAGGLMERWESRWASSQRRYENLETVTLVPCWSTPAMRFCTSELKTHVIVADLKRRFRGMPIINVTGIRADESASRALQPVASQQKGSDIWNWRPILKWSTEDVFNAIEASRMAPHPAYRSFGMTRVSCRFCIMSSMADMKAAAMQEESHNLYRRMVGLETISTFAFQGSRWLGDLAPRLLEDRQIYAFQEAKLTAARRVAAEKRITKPMLYVKGWPTRTLTNEEADILADVRREVSSMMGFQPMHIDRESIHERYAFLLDQKARKTT